MAYQLWAYQLWVYRLREAALAHGAAARGVGETRRVDEALASAARRPQ